VEVMHCIHVHSNSSLKKTPHDGLDFSRILHSNTQPSRRTLSRNPAHIRIMHAPPGRITGIMR
jgi:hypothetical protein